MYKIKNYIRDKVPFPLRERIKKICFFGKSKSHCDLLLPLERKHKFIFIHIPKTGGTAISHALFGQEVLHRRVEELAKFDLSTLKRCTVFCVVRHPIQRFLSAFNYLIGGGSNQFDKTFFRDTISSYQESPDLFIREYLAGIGDLSSLKVYPHFRTQASFLKMANGKIRVNKIINYDNIQSEFNLFCNEFSISNISLQKKNVTPAKRFSEKDLSEEATLLIHKMYACDFILLEKALATNNSNQFN